MTGKQIAPWQQAIAKAKDKFMQVSTTGTGVAYEKEAMFAMQAITRSGYLMEIANNNPASLRDAVINVSAIGISLNPAEKLAYLVPRGGAACLDISYMGLLKLATDTGSILWAKADIVYARDTFTYHGPSEKPTHLADVFAEDRGEPVGVYCVAKTRDGEYLTETMTRREVEAVREKSKGAGKADSPWSTFPGEMWKKTVIKRASKTWPKTDRSKRFDEAIRVLNETEGLSEEYLQPQQREEIPMPQSKSARDIEPESEPETPDVIEGEVIEGTPEPDMTPASPGSKRMILAKMQAAGLTEEQLADKFAVGVEDLTGGILNDVIAWIDNAQPA